MKEQANITIPRKIKSTVYRKIQEDYDLRLKIAADNNILVFIAVHSANQDFYIDGTKRTRKEKPEVTDNTTEVIMKFAYQKDDNGLNIILDERQIFADVFKYALGNKEKTKIYVYDTNKAIKTR